MLLFCCLREGGGKEKEGREGGKEGGRKEGRKEERGRKEGGGREGESGRGGKEGGRERSFAYRKVLVNACIKVVRNIHTPPFIPPSLLPFYFLSSQPASSLPPSLSLPLPSPPPVHTAPVPRADSSVLPSALSGASSGALWSPAGSRERDVHR